MNITKIKSIMHMGANRLKGAIGAPSMTVFWEILLENSWKYPQKNLQKY
jgi:hypothetical protein